MAKKRFNDSCLDCNHERYSLGGDYKCGCHKALKDVMAVTGMPYAEAKKLLEHKLRKIEKGNNLETLEYEIFLAKKYGPFRGMQ